MKRVIFDVYGTPEPQGSLSHIPGNGRGPCRIVHPRKLTYWRQIVTATAIEQYQGDPLFGPVALVLDFRFARPMSHYRTGAKAGELKTSAPTEHTGTPDLDKLVRAIGDGLDEAGVYVDDRVVSSITASKRFVELPGEKPGVTITITAP